MVYRQPTVCHPSFRKAPVLWNVLQALGSAHYTTFLLLLPALVSSDFRWFQLQDSVHLTSFGLFQGEHETSAAAATAAAAAAPAQLEQPGLAGKEVK